jgi:hemerythrin-like domain-containing protein
MAKKTAARKRPKKPAARPAARKKQAARKTPRKAGAAKARSTRRPPGKNQARKKAPKTRATAVRGAVAGAIAAVADRLPWTSDQPDAIQLLETDHRRMEELLRKGEETTENAIATRTALLDTISREFGIHELIEERVLYPALKAHPEATDIVLEGYQEHHVADVLVEELHALPKDDERWGAKLKVLQESIQHHIEEEEGKMFRTARAVFSRDELRALGVRMAQMKADAQEKEGRRS